MSTWKKLIVILPFLWLPHGFSVPVCSRTGRTHLGSSRLIHVHVKNRRCIMRVHSCPLITEDADSSQSDVCVMICNLWFSAPAKGYLITKNSSRSGAERKKTKKTAAEADGLQLFAHLQILWDAVTRIAGYLVSSQIHRQIHCRYPWLQR